MNGARQPQRLVGGHLRTLAQATLTPSGYNSQVPSRNIVQRTFDTSGESQLATLLDLDGHPMPGEHREAELHALLDRLIGVLDELVSIEAVAAKDADGAFKAMGVTGPARAAIDSYR